MTMTLTYFDVEVPEAWADVQRDDYGNVRDYFADPSKFPEDPKWAEALNRVLSRPDEATCEVPDCDAPIGWVLHEDDEEPWRSGITWRWVSLVDAGRYGVAAVCEDDCPANLYEIAAEDAARARARKEKARGA